MKSVYLQTVSVSFKLDIDYASSFLSDVSSREGVFYVGAMSHEQTLAFIARSLVVVNSSQSEGMSQALLEAMTLQVPVLARDIPGNRAIVQDGVTGLLFSDAQVHNAYPASVSFYCTRKISFRISKRKQSFY